MCHRSLAHSTARSHTGVLGIGNCDYFGRGAVASASLRGDGGARGHEREDQKQAHQPDDRCPAVAPRQTNPAPRPRRALGLRRPEIAAIYLDVGLELRTCSPASCPKRIGSMIRNPCIHPSCGGREGARGAPSSFIHPVRQERGGTKGARGSRAPRPGVFAPPAGGRSRTRSRTAVRHGCTVVLPRR